MKKLNFILLTIDALRPDHLGRYGYTRATDEALDPYRDHLAVFKNAYTYSYPTMRAFPVIHSSIWPDLCTSDVFWQYAKKITLPRSARTLSEIFKSQGYYTTSHTTWSNFLTSSQGYGRGVDDFVGMLRQDRMVPKNVLDRVSSLLWRRFIYSLRYMPSKTVIRRMEQTFHWLRETVNSVTGSNMEEAGGVQGRSGEVLTQYLLDRLSERQAGPFFAWGHYHDVHVPLSPPKQYAYDSDDSPLAKRQIQNAILKAEPLPTDVRDNMINLYDGEIRGVFYQIRRVFDFLKEKGLLDSTCVAITSDHGFGFWEHDYWEYPEGQFYDESVRVPLYIYHPEQIHKFIQIGEPVSLMDLAPTILDLSRLPTEERFFGTSFASLLQRQSPGGERAIWLETLGPPKLTCQLRNGHKIIFNEDLQQFCHQLNSRDEIRTLNLNEKRTFLEDLKKYNERKLNFLKTLQAD
jgi:arylsulfatase A-like enzyme